MRREFCGVGVIMNVGHSGTKPKLQYEREIFSPAFFMPLYDRHLDEAPDEMKWLLLSVNISFLGLRVAKLQC